MALLFGESIDGLGASMASGAPPESSTSIMSKSALHFVYLGIGVTFLSFFASYFLDYVADKLVSRVKRLAFENVLKQELAWFDESIDNSAGSIANRINTDSVIFREGIGRYVCLTAAAHHADIVAHHADIVAHHADIAAQ